KTEEAEFNGIYRLDVVIIPTNRPIAREDLDDVIYKTKKAKYKAIVEEIKRLHRLGLPILVGTTTVEVSELLSRLLKLQGINHNVLNAKYHKMEAEIVAEAGRIGAVTIATNMAGRGTDIKLAPGVLDLPARWAADPDVKPEDWEGQATGLQIIGTERHESRRIDRQLRGRSGRQGDPGAAQFFLSLEDDLMRLFSPERIVKVMDRLGVQEDEVITHSMVTRAIEKAQVRVENQNFDIRKHLLEYDDVVNKQREVVYQMRRDALEGRDLDEQFRDFMGNAVDGALAECVDPEAVPDDWDLEKLGRLYGSLVLAPLPVAPREHLQMGYDELSTRLHDQAAERYRSKSAYLGEHLTGQLQKFVLIQVLDEQWRDHLNELILLRSGIGLRSYGQRDPLVEYKGEAFRMFEALVGNVEKSAINLFFRAELAPPPQRPATPPPVMQTRHQEVSAFGAGGEAAPAEPAAAQRPRPVVNVATANVGRNDPCPCGSGKKYKKCCGA
ncbi:preprotein translocase subunit SecA, partial [bacterium]|nr:preprotein translocase subunit SecA [bacterium]